MPTPHILNTQLFIDVQSSRMFSDSKTFADAQPNKEIDVLLKLYADHKNDTDFNLKDFVHMHFDILTPDPSADVALADIKPIEQHIKNLWLRLMQQADTYQIGSTKISLPQPYIVPGGRFQEIYYWDSYFTMIGLRHHGHMNVIASMIDNFAYFIDTYGFIPNGNRHYFLSRSQPPFFSLMVELLADIEGDDILINYLPQLVSEYQFWMNGSNGLTDHIQAIGHTVRIGDHILNRYWDKKSTPREESYIEDIELAKQADRPDAQLYRDLRAACASGWDFSSRWYKIKDDFSSIETSAIIPIDLNCLLYNLESLIAKIYLKLSDMTESNRYNRLADRRKEAIVDILWNKDKKLFCDYNFVAKTSTDAETLAMAFPLYFGLASPSQTERTYNFLTSTLLKAGGFVTTSVASGQQWDSPNGWAPLQWITVVALHRNGYTHIAEEAAHRWVLLNEKVYSQTGKMMEKYNVIDIDLPTGGGEYPNQDGFGWTNGVYLGFKHHNYR
ncbi:UNVERIFIED_CONTAM: hypothetical protein GTU68_031740 [Idotea baltica]|nr:hypothetical protein [Idotea baltica]